MTRPVGMHGVDTVLVEHRAAAERTRLDVDDLSVYTGILRAALGAATDGAIDAAAVRLGVLLSLLPVRHPLVVAARLGLEVGEARRVARRATRAAGHEIHGGEGARWRRWAQNRVPYDELQRRRAVPGTMPRQQGRPA